MIKTKLSSRDRMLAALTRQSLTMFRFLPILVRAVVEGTFVLARSV